MLMRRIATAEGISPGACAVLRRAGQTVAWRVMFADIADRTWLWAAAGFYFAGFVLGTLSILRSGRPSGAANSALIITGYAFQLLGLGIRGKAVAG